MAHCVEAMVVEKKFDDVVARVWPISFIQASQVSSSKIQGSKHFVLGTMVHGTMESSELYARRAPRKSNRGEMSTRHAYKCLTMHFDCGSKRSEGRQCAFITL